MKTPKPSLAAATTATIQKEQITPRSLTSLMIEQLGYASLCLVLFFLVVLGVNFIGFWLRISGFGDFLTAGSIGVQAFLTGFPYGLFVVTLLVFSILLAIFRHYDLSYKRPFLLAATVLLLLAVGIGAAIARSAVNERLAQQVEQGQLRPLRLLYLHRLDFRHHSRYAIVGPLVGKDGNRLIIQTRIKPVTIQTTDKTQYPHGQPTVGDRIRTLIEESQTNELPVARIIFVTPLRTER